VSDEPFDVLTLVLRGWRRVAVCLLLGISGGLVYGLVAPKWYSATLTVVPSQRSQDVASSLAAKLPSIGGLDSGLTTDVQRIQAVLSSNSVTDEVITRFNLGAHYETDYLEHTRQSLWEHCWIRSDRKSAVVSLTCEDKEPKQAMAIAAYFGEVGNRVFGRVSASSAREERRFLETQVAKARKDVDDSSQKLRAFQERHKIVDLPEQSKAVISAMASIKGELISKQLELSYLRSFSGGTEPRVVQLQQQIGVMESKLSQLEAQRKVEGSDTAAKADDKANSSFFPNAMNVPELRFELEQLIREQKIAETVFFLTTQRYEMAKVDEARDTSTFQILDYPTLPTYKSRPRRSKALMLGLLAGLFAGGGSIVVPAWWRRRAASAASRAA
jgi:tyrosine-protein kinase Etk/Wzc